MFPGVVANLNKSVIVVGHFGCFVANIIMQVEVATIICSVQGRFGHN
jgi:hypothetical protein